MQRDRRQGRRPGRAWPAEPGFPATISSPLAGAGDDALPRLGRLDAAARGLAAVWHDFREAGFRQELTMVSLDLAEVLPRGVRESLLCIVRIDDGIDSP